MIYFSFAVHNPFWNRKFSSLYNKVIPVTKNKSIEIEFCKNNSIIGGSIGITARQSHAGFSFDIDLLGYNLDIAFYDNRHWNSDTKSYEDA